MIKRTIHDNICEKLFKKKIIVVYGARQVGKTTLLRQLQKSHPELSSMYLNCDEPDIRESLSNKTSTELNDFTGSNKIVFIDEAQRIENAGLTLKLFIDNFPDKQIIATGSSAFELSDKIKEPLTGRKYEFNLYPFSFSELKADIGTIEIKRKLEKNIIFGMYPDVVLSKGEEKSVLLTLSNDYLYKDIFKFEKIRKPDLIEKLLKALALQIGGEVSYNELANLLGVRKETIISYTDILEKAFIIFRFSSFSKNLRNELSKKKQKFYFWDTGIRNALINNFSVMNLRPDNGGLWENFIISERIKFLHNSNTYRNSYFWRTTQQQEIDYIETEDEKIFASEIKWNAKKKVNFSKTFLNNYKCQKTSIVNPAQYIEFLTKL